MFGLRVPVRKSLASADFDGLQTILYNSGLREPCQWLSKANKKGEIFQLELEETTDSQTSQTSDKECMCVCSDCATDDTGYSTDSDIHASFYKGNSKRKPISDFDAIGDVLRNSYYSDSCSVNDNHFHKVEEDIDYLFKSANLDQVTHGETVTLGDDVQLDIADILSLDDSLSIASYGYTEIQDIPSPSRIYKHLQKDFMAFSKMSSEKCKCTTVKDQSMKHYNIEVNLKLKGQPLRTENGKLSTVELCEQLLGIIPGHFGSVQSGENTRRKDRRVKIRGLVPTGVTSKYGGIRVGDCLLTINNCEVTWDNFTSILMDLISQRQAKLVLKRNSKLAAKSGSLLLKRKNLSSAERLIQLMTGSNSNTMLDDIHKWEWEPFYGAMYLSLEGINSENMQAKEDIVYQFPKADNKVIASRGMFITLAGTLLDVTQSVIQSSTLMIDNSPVHVVYHCEGKNLFVMSAPENRFSIRSLVLLIKDLVRLLQINHGSVHQAFVSSANHNQLDCLFALLHQSQLHPSENGEPVHKKSCNISQSVKILSLPNEIKLRTDGLLTDFEAADFGDMSDNYYGCRRSYNILGTCMFYKNYLICNHLPKDDLIDFSTYLKYHSLLTLSTDQSLGQLVVWRQVHPTRHCHAVPEEQQFGYTEPLIAKWFWLIVGYKNFIMCVLLEIGGCTRVIDAVSPPDPFLIDQARAVLFQLYGQNIASHCQNSLSKSPFIIKYDILNNHHRHDLISRSLRKLPHRDSNTVNSNGITSSTYEISGSLRRGIQTRKSSVESDNSSESSGESFFKFSRKGRLFPETSDLIQNMSAFKEDITTDNTSRKLSVGAENCLFHFLYVDNMEGVLISSDIEPSTSSDMSHQIYTSFQKCCQQIKTLFDNARRVQEQSKTFQQHVLGLNEDFCTVREEGVMFTCTDSNHNKKSTPLYYWVVGRCLSRTTKREIYVCFHKSVPQTSIELAFKLALGYLPL